MMGRIKSGLPVEVRRGVLEMVKEGCDSCESKATIKWFYDVCGSVNACRIYELTWRGCCRYLAHRATTVAGIYEGIVTFPVPLEEVKKICEEYEQSLPIDQQGRPVYHPEPPKPKGKRKAKRR
jgi:hypothetical protein